MNALLKFFSMIKFEHTIFALPFAYIGMMLGFGDNDASVKIIILVTVAMASARTAAMALNRIIDRKIDAANERTKKRELVTGEVKLKSAYLFTFLSIIIFELTTYFINDLAFKLSPVALFFLLTYSYTKRFTLLSHLYLGATDAIAPLGGYVSASGNLNNPGIWYLAIFVALWIAGFDILYATQDEKFDRKYGLHSIPVAFGTYKALNIAKIFHLVGFAFLVVSIYQFSLNAIAYFGALIVAILLIVEHRLVDPNDLTKVNIAFFNINGYISVVLFFTFLIGKYYA